MSIACTDCGALLDLAPLPSRSSAFCPLCRSVLEKRSGRSIAAALACSIGTLLLLFPGNLLPLIQVDLFGMRAANVIGEGIADLWRDQWILLSGLTAVFVIVLPFIVFALLTAVLGSLLLGRRRPWLGSAFRWALRLDPWAMVDVFLLASFVGYYRMINLGQAHVSIGLGGICFMAAGLLTMLSRATLDRRTVWRAIEPDTEAPFDDESLSCTICSLIRPVSCEGQPCPRCGARLQTRRTDALPRTAALLVAALILFFPANLLPMNVSSQLGSEKSYTIFTGVRDLFDAGIWPLGVLVFCTSILIPFGKIVAIGWCVLSVRRSSSAHLRSKTMIFRLVAELGRWSKTDPFTIVFFVPLVHFGALASSSAGWGATAFLGMSVLTMFASYTFEPRLMWDVARLESA